MVRCGQTFDRCRRHAQVRRRRQQARRVLSARIDLIYTALPAWRTDSMTCAVINLIRHTRWAHRRVTDLGLRHRTSVPTHTSAPWLELQRFAGVSVWGYSWVIKDRDGLVTSSQTSANMVSPSWKQRAELETDNSGEDMHKADAACNFCVAMTLDSKK